MFSIYFCIFPILVSVIFDCEGAQSDYLFIDPLTYANHLHDFLCVHIANATSHSNDVNIFTFQNIKRGTELSVNVHSDKMCTL